MGIDLITLKRFRTFGFAAFIQNLRDGWMLQYALQRQQWFLYLPIFLSFGIGAYYMLPLEPPLALGAFALILSLSALFAARGRGFALACMLCIICLGFFAAQMRTSLVHTPILQSAVGPTNVQGRIVSIEDLGDEAGSRLVLSELSIEGVSTEDTPRKIRLKSRKDEGLFVGQRISTLAKIHSPSPPVMPGGFDFQRYLYFQGIGGVGFIYKDIEVLEDAASVSLPRMIEGVRHEVGRRIEQVMEYPQAGVAMALVIGRKTAIPKDNNEAMREAGLAHMLAISGLHVGLFSGALFFLVRLFLSVVPGLALHYPIKKYAAIAAMFGAFFYMLLAGSSIPTQRAMLMTGVVFLAIILDRSAISLRLVAFAAFIVLLFFSESLLSASFHMSFAAVAGLVAFYDWLRPYWSAWHRRSGWLRRAGLYFLGVSFTTIIATAATAPFALYHFQQLAAYSILGNFIAVPILAFLIMPSILAALFMMPFGLEFIPLYVTDLGVDAVLNIADWVSSLPHSVFRMGAWPQAALVAIVFSGLALILLRGAVRLLCLLPLFIAIIVFSGYSPPDILISDKAKLVSVRDGRGDLYVSNLRSERFARENWMQSYGVDDARVHKWPKEGAEGFVACGEMACRINIQGRLVSYIYHETAAAQECAAADLVVAPFPLYKLCVSETSALRIDRAGTKRKGAHGVWFGDNGGIVIKTSQELRGARPWSSLNESFR